MKIRFYTLLSLLILTISCNQKGNNSIDDNPEENEELKQIESKPIIEKDVVEAAKNSLKFDEIQPLAALTGKKEYSVELKRLNSEYQKIEDKYINNKVEFTQLVGKYRDSLQSKK